MAQLTPKQHKAVEALILHPTRTAAAAAIGISRATMTRWCADDAFRSALRQASWLSVDHTIAQLRTAAGEAVNVLRDALKDPSPAVRVRAAVALLDAVIKCDSDELNARMEVLEAAMKAEGKAA